MAVSASGRSVFVYNPHDGLMAANNSTAAANTTTKLNGVQVRPQRRPPSHVPFPQSPSSNYDGSSDCHIQPVPSSLRLILLRWPLRVDVRDLQLQSLQANMPARPAFSDIYSIDTKTGKVSHCTHSRPSVPP